MMSGSRCRRYNEEKTAMAISFSYMRLGPWKNTTIRMKLLVGKVYCSVLLTWDVRHFGIELYWDKER